MQRKTYSKKKHAFTQKEKEYKKGEYKSNYICFIILYYLPYYSLILNYIILPIYGKEGRLCWRILSDIKESKADEKDAMFINL